VHNAILCTGKILAKRRVKIKQALGEGKMLLDVSKTCLPMLSTPA
jgi:hypothetical protein